MLVCTMTWGATCTCCSSCTSIVLGLFWWGGIDVSACNHMRCYIKLQQLLHQYCPRAFLTVGYRCQSVQWHEVLHVFVLQLLHLFCPRGFLTMGYYRCYSAQWYDVLSAPQWLLAEWAMWGVINIPPSAVSSQLPVFPVLPPHHYPGT